MRQRLGRIVGWDKGDLSGEPENMPLEWSHGRSATTPNKHALRASGGKNAFEVLTEDQVAARIQVAEGQLRRLGAFHDTSSIPMSELNDEQLDQRICQVEAELRKINTRVVVDDGPAEMSFVEKADLVREFDKLAFLLDHPDATLDTAAAVDTIDDEARYWASCFPPDDNDSPADDNVRTDAWDR